jgi:hypothetical protein
LIRWPQPSLLQSFHRYSNLIIFLLTSKVRASDLYNKTWELKLQCPRLNSTSILCWSNEFHLVFVI